MSTTYSPAPAPLKRSLRANQRPLDGARSLAALLLAAAVSALVVLADQLIDAWADGHLFLGWVALWVVIFAGSALFAGTARRLARRTMVALDGWSRSLAEARAQARLWEMAQRDPQLRARFLAAAATQPTAAAVDVTTASFAASVPDTATVATSLATHLAAPALANRLAPTAATAPGATLMRGRSGYLPYL